MTDLRKDTSLKTAIVGCGAMGSVYAGKLAAAGVPVLAISRSTAHVAAINANGLRLTWPSGEETVRLDARAQVPATPMDLVVLAVKAADVEAAARACLPLLTEQTVVLTLQNGLGSADQVAAVVGAQRLIVGVASGFGASLPAPGHVHYNAMKLLRFGAYAELSSSSLNRVVALWQGASFNVAAADNIAVIQWEKLICNVAYSAPCALTGLTVGEVLRDPNMRALSVAAATEAWEIARAKGVPITVTDPAQFVHDFAAAMPDAKPSALLDHEAQRPSEIDVINGAVPREAAKLGKTAPVNTLLTTLVRARERQWQAAIPTKRKESP